MAQTKAPVTYRFQASRDYPHVEWIELDGDGLLHECAILKTDANGQKLFIKTNNLDDIDRRRLAGILADRNARNFELFDLMSQKTLGNGLNALAYFHQLVKVLTPNGKVLDPKTGVIGLASGTMKIDPPPAA